MYSVYGTQASGLPNNVAKELFKNLTAFYIKLEKPLPALPVNNGF